MSKNSKFEGYSDKMLFRVLKMIIESCDDEGINWEKGQYDSEVSGAIREAVVPLGIEIVSYLDEDFLWSLLKKNITLLGNDKLEQPLIRPEANEYSFQTTVSETVYQTSYYQDTMTSYSDNPYYIVKAMEYNGDYDYWEGNQVHTDIHDSETNNITIQKKFNKL